MLDTPLRLTGCVSRKTCSTPSKSLTLSRRVRVINGTHVAISMAFRSLMVPPEISMSFQARMETSVGGQLPVVGRVSTHHARLRTPRSIETTLIFLCVYIYTYNAIQLKRNEMFVWSSCHVGRRDARVQAMWCHPLLRTPSYAHVPPKPRRRQEEASTPRQEAMRRSHANPWP